MDLKLYLDSRNLTHKEFARMLDISPSTLSNYVCWRRKPALDIARRIEKVTKGKVSIDDLLAYWECKKDHEGKKVIKEKE